MPKRSAQAKKRRIKKSEKKAVFTKKLRKFMTGTLVLSISLTFLAGYLVYNRLTREMASAFSADSNDILSEPVFSVIVVRINDFDQKPLTASSIKFYLYDKGTLKLIEYDIPVSLEIDAPGKYSNEPLSNVMALGDLSEDGLEEGISMIRETVRKIFAFPVDRFVITEDGTHGLVENIISGGTLSELRNTDLTAFKEAVKTNLSFKELLDVYTFARSLPTDRVIKKVLSDSYLSDLSLLDEDLMDITFDSMLSKEQKSIAILNGTEYSGVASFGSRMVKNAGGRVVAVSNTQEKYEKSRIIVDEANSESARTLKRIFNIDDVVLYTDNKNFAENEINRSDITVILGLDFADTL